MLAIYASAVFICLGSLLLGQSVLRLCGASRWSWLSAPVGLSAMVLIAIPSLHIPGRSTTVAVVLLVLVVAAAERLLRAPAHRPPLPGLAAGLPIGLLTTLPFLSAGTAGTLGWSFNNDMAAHLLLADAYRTESVEQFNSLLPDYPLGPHALVSVVAQGAGIGVDEAFAGLTVAAAVLIGWTALAALRRPRKWAPLPVAALVGMPFLIAGYFGQGSFKELLQALLVLGAAILLAFPPDLSRRRRWIPMALLLAGCISIYSFLGLVWPVAFLGLWFTATALKCRLGTDSLRSAVREARTGVLPVLVGLVTLLVVITPQTPRLHEFIASKAGTNGTGIRKDDIGNLVGRLPIWEAFGIWDNPDYRLPAADQFMNGLWTGLALGLVLFGTCWALRRGEGMLVAATAMTVVVWAVADRLQSPYVAAKALVILTPLLMLVAARALAERDEPDFPMPGWWQVAAPALALLLVVRVGESSWDALRHSKVGPRHHTAELRGLQPILDGRPTLFLGNDDFTRWELGETPVEAPVIGFPVLAFRPEKRWTYGQSYDVDSLDATTLNGFDWIITPRDAASSAPPEQLRLVRRTRNFLLYRRTAPIPPRSVIDEGDTAAGRLDCTTREGQQLVRRGGQAAVRDATISVPAPPLPPGAAATISMPLTPGSWDLVSTYVGPRPLRVTGAGLDTTLVPHLDRPGPRWPIGRVRVYGSGPLKLTLGTTKDRWTPTNAIVTPNAVIAVPAGTGRVVPIKQACGRLVDWYRTR